MDGEKKIMINGNGFSFKEGETIHGAGAVATFAQISTLLSEIDGAR